MPIVVQSLKMDTINSFFPLYVNTTPQVKRWRLGLFPLHLSPVTRFDQASLLASDSYRAALAMN